MRARDLSWLKPQRKWLRVAPPILILIAIVMYCAFPQPIHDDATLKAVAGESQALMAIHPISPGAQPIEIPRDKWPSAIASLDPDSVKVRNGLVDITTQPYFDGSWGYGFAADQQSLTMLPDCWSYLAHDVYWHAPC